MQKSRDTATPAALEAERTLLGAVLLDERQLVHIVDVLPPAAASGSTARPTA
jgi:replicative DNA helicase